MPVNVEDLFKQHSTAVEAKLDEMGLSVKTAREQLAQIEQKMSRKPGPAGGGTEDGYGAQLVSTEPRI